MKKLILVVMTLTLALVSSAVAQVDPNSRPLHHFYELQKDFYHFYTADPDEAAALKKNKGWKYVGITGYILAKKTADTVELFRLVKAQFGGTNHFYTTDMNEANEAALKHGWTAEGIAGYVAPKQIADTTPLYRLYLVCNGNSSNDSWLAGQKFAVGCELATGGDVHYYTTSGEEKYTSIYNGMKFIGTTAYIWTQPVQKKTVPEPKDTAGARKAMIYLGYATVFGREPTANDFTYWDGKAKAEQTTYLQLFNELRDWLNGDTPPGNGELNATVRRAFAESGKPAPNFTELVTWMKTSRQKKLWFVPLKTEIGKQPVAKQQSGGFPESQDKFDERKAMIRKQYYVVFGRAPLENDYTYWNAKAKAEGTTSAQLFNALRDWLASSQGEMDLNATIKRAFAANGKPEPNFSQLDFWRKESKAKMHWFEMLKLEIKQKVN